MKKFFVFIMLLQISFHLSAQHLFNKRVTLNSLSSQLTNILEHKGSYYSIGVCLDSSNYNAAQNTVVPRWGIRFTKWSLDGNIMLDTFYQKPYTNIEPWNACVSIISDSSFIITSQWEDTSSTNKIHISSMDTTGKVLLEKIIDKPICSQHYFLNVRDLKRTPTGEWISWATMMCPYGNISQADMILSKYDSAFNVIWHKQFGASNKMDGANKLLIANDGNYVLGSTQDNRMYITFPQADATYQTMLTKTDTAGNILWTWKSDSTALIGYMTDLIQTQDGGYIYCGYGDGFKQYNDTFSGIAYIQVRPWIEKLDSNRNVVWHKAFGIHAGFQSNDVMKSLKELPNGDIVASGSIVFSNSVLDTSTFNLKSAGLLAKFSSDGQIKWAHTYRIPPFSHDHIFQDLKPTSDGGFIMAGQTKRYSSSTTSPTQQAWLVKVDSNGCFGIYDPQCIENVANVPQVAASTSVQVYPNPVLDVLNIASTGKVQLIITDILGKTVIHKSWSEKQSHRKVDVSILAPGIYVYKIWDAGKLAKVGKLNKL